MQVNKVGNFKLALSACQIYFYCKKCYSICRRFHYVDLTGKKKIHNCDRSYCKVCKCNRKRIHDCFISTKNKNVPFYMRNFDQNYHIYVYDFETEARPSNMGIFVPYYRTVYKFCNICMNDYNCKLEYQCCTFDDWMFFDGSDTANKF